ncbi:hypothetical protein CDAR_249491 [Caerostris darwini]|uniref:Uncharacterized protein n=1 Tax=Caerostris darwini TaxID=1538125 RepID=A0AAV4TRS6_9ARAC|nr:hypothetical protein CDAR_249491 [Caerostris darwini]
MTFILVAKSSAKQSEDLCTKLLEEELKTNYDYLTNYVEEQRRGDNVPNPNDLSDISKGKLSLDQMKDIGVLNITRTGRHVKISEKLNL